MLNNFLFTHEIYIYSTIKNFFPLIKIFIKQVNEFFLLKIPHFPQ